MPQEELLVNIKRVAKLVDDFMLKNIQGEIKDLYEASRHLMKAGGKRLRPFLIVTGYNVFREDIERVLPVAAAVEIFHTFTLIHDDIMDRDEFRRGVPTVHKVWGEPMAILAGDLLHAKTYELLSKADLPPQIIARLVREMAEAATIICEGQAMDMSFEERMDVTVDEYFEMIKRKTAFLFRLSARFGGIVAAANEEAISALTRYGEDIGIAFQMIDDILGLFGKEEETGKPVGSDVRESKKTYPILYALEKASGEDKDTLRRILTKKEKTEEDIKIALEIIKRSGGEEATRKLAREYAERAINAITSLPENNARKLLVQLAEFVIERSY